MKNWIGLTLSGLMLATLSACSPIVKVASASETVPISARAAARKLPLLLASAQTAIERADGATAVHSAEAAVAMNRQRAESRALLGRAYLAAGRFKSAEAALGDALTLDPTLGRAAVTRALTQIAMGDGEAALASLDRAKGSGAEEDIGLALALAGHGDEAIGRLEAAARAADASPHARQNLALAYALQGRWADASATAALDIPAEQLTARMQRWSQIAQHRDQPGVQIAMLLGVLPTADAGQPAALALAQPDSPVQVAEVVTPAAPPAEAAAPVMLAEAPALPAPRKPVQAARPVAAKPVVARSVLTVASRAAPRAFAPGAFVVQLGAYGSVKRTEAMWNSISGRAHYLSAYTPVGSDLRRGSATLYRLSLSGFGNRNEASRLCGRIKASGGDCFVRRVSGDRPVQWVMRKKDGEAA